MCSKLKTLMELKAPCGGIRAEKVDDVITTTPTNLMLYIIMPDTPPFLSHVDPFPCNKFPFRGFRLVNGSFFL